ncbi:MAG: hypothetical protein ACHP7O_13045 [Burkholderiales bacterium]
MMPTYSFFESIMKRSLLLTAIGLLFAGTAQAELPVGWRVPTTQELDDGTDWRKKDANLFLSASGDFDGDQKKDSAQLLVNDSKNSMALFVILSSQNYKPMLLDEIKDKKMIGAMGISLAKPGSYKTACGKDYFDCKKNEPDNILLEGLAIDYFKEESANSFFVWQPKSRSFVRYWMSD